VVILTAPGRFPTRSTPRRGVFGFLPKPFESRELLAQVEQALKPASAAGHGTAERGAPAS
jgi:two-component system response regulator GlrR